MKNKQLINIKFFAFLAIFGLVLFPALALASTGTINSTNRYAWSENAGYIDFGSTQGNVQITDTELTGYAYSPKIGWIIFNCQTTDTCTTVNYKVSSNYVYAGSETPVVFAGGNANQVFTPAKITAPTTAVGARNDGTRAELIAEIRIKLIDLIRQLIVALQEEMNR